MARAPRGRRPIAAAGRPVTVEQALARALVAQQGGRLDKAAAIYRRILELRPRHAVALHRLGLCRYQGGDPRGAADLIERAIAAEPADATAHANLSLVYRDLGRLAEAEAAARRAIAIEPDYAEAHDNLGVVLRLLNRLCEAEAAHRRALALQPDHVAATNNLGIVLDDLERLQEAAAAFRRTIALRPSHAKAHHNLARVLERSGSPQEAVELYRRAVELDPGYHRAFSRLGTLLHRLQQPSAAEAAFRRAVALAPTEAQYHFNLATVLADARRLSEAEAAYRRAIALDPQWPLPHSALLVALNYRDDLDDEALYAAHLDWARRHTPKYPPQPHRNDPDPQRRLRVGYVSPDFRRHVVSTFFEPLLAAHDRRRVEIFCYAAVPRPDEITARLRRQADHWRDIVGIDDQEAAAGIRRDGIDVLVDLAGHTGFNRLRVFAYKPAPVQVTWMGYCNTSGLSVMDYLLSSPGLIPAAARRYYSEQVYDLDRYAACYLPPDGAPDPAPPPVLADGRVTFGCYNYGAKVGSAAVDCWRRILEAVPGSRLILKSQSFGDEAARRTMVERCTAAGVDGERLLVEPPSVHADYLRSYGRIDVALDPFPYNGGTTTYEALWMGVPLIALRGERMIARVGAAILTAIDLPELIAESVDDYVAKAVALASDPSRLARLRDGMRERMATSPLLDSAGLARAMEAAYRDVWQRWCAAGTAAPEGGDYT